MIHHKSYQLLQTMVTHVSMTFDSTQQINSMHKFTKIASDKTCNRSV